LGIKLLNKARSARLGNIISGVGMLLAIVTTLGEKDIAHFKWVLISGLLGTLVGLCMAIKVKMTSMPEMVALLNGFGGFASLLVGYAEGLKPITKTLFDFDQLFNQFTTVTTYGLVELPLQVVL
jgi:NAD(P) transhydrogenase subunit beta